MKEAKELHIMKTSSDSPALGNKGFKGDPLGYPDELVTSILILNQKEIDEKLNKAEKAAIKTKWKSMKGVGKKNKKYQDYCNFSLEIACSIAVDSQKKCAGCGCPGSFDTEKNPLHMMSFDSIIPHYRDGWYHVVIHEGKIVKSNVQCLHYFCNTTKMQYSQEDYKKHSEEIKKIEKTKEHKNLFERYYEAMGDSYVS